MQFVIVQYHREREVYMDGNLAGKTNVTLRVQEGSHRFDLGEPKTYHPEFHEKQIACTTQIRPEVVTFTSMAREEVKE